MVSAVLNIINTTLSATFLTVLISCLCYFCSKKICIERCFKLIFVMLTFAFVFKLGYCVLNFFIDWSERSGESLKFIAWNVSSVSYIQLMYVFDALIAKVFTVVFALARRRMSQAVQLIKKTNLWIFWIGIILMLMLLTVEIIELSLFFKAKQGSDERHFIHNFALQSKLFILVAEGCWQLICLVLLYPLAGLYKAALVRHGLKSHFKEQKLPRRFVKTFLFLYFLRSVVIVGHATYCIIQIQRLNSDTITNYELSVDLMSYEILCLAEDIISGCTLLLCLVFFQLISRNLEVARENFRAL